MRFDLLCRKKSVSLIKMSAVFKRLLQLESLLQIKSTSHEMVGGNSKVLEESVYLSKERPEKGDKLKTSRM